MSDNSNQPWRPPLAPKPPPAALHPTNVQGRDASPALRGASVAFGPHGAKTAVSAQAQNNNAARAAAAAGRSRPQQASGDGIGVRSAVEPARGRSQLTLDLDQAARSLQASSFKPRPAVAPPLSRTTSEIAARAASASTSPARTSESAASRGSSPHKRFQSSFSREASSMGRGRTNTDGGTDAFRGATVSMSSSPRPVLKGTLSSSPGKLDMHHIPSLALSSSGESSPPKQQLSNTGASTVQAANTGAGTHAKDAVSSPRPIVPPPRTAQSAIQKASSATSPFSRSIPKTSLPSNRHQPSQTRSSGDSLPVPGSPMQRLQPVSVPDTRHGRVSPKPPGTPSLSPRERGAITANTLADAIVASSVASSRVQSPAPSKSRRPKPPPIPHHRSQSLNAREPKRPVENPPLKPMPVRPMRQTLRKQEAKADDDEDGKRGRKHLLRKHPNMHHEGDRKRWRDKVTERERKRYEGVWAANRGLLHQYETADEVRHRTKGTGPDDLVLNVVVKDIWDRSRLPRDVLEEIWDLVSDGESKSLNREEFVVGMWLIDQWLKGRKLPAVKVSPSVWASVRHTSGVKIRNKPL